VVKVLGTQEIALDNKVLAYSFGGNVTVKYSKTTGSATRDSLPLILSVQDIADGDPRLPTPTIDRVTGDELNPADLLPTDHTRTTAWPLIAVGQRVDLTYREIKRDGSAGIILEAYKGKEVTAEDLGGIRHPVPLDKLLMLEDDSTLEIEAKVSFDKTETGYRSLPKKVYTIEKGFDDLTTFTNRDWNGWTNAQPAFPLEISLMDDEYFVLAGYGYIGLKKTYHNIKSGDVLELSFDYRLSSQSGLRVVRNGDGQLFGYTVEPLPASTAWRKEKIQIIIYDTPPADFQLEFGISGSANSSIDNVRVRTVIRT
jgi:hypothetical protein